VVMARERVQGVMARQRVQGWFWEVAVARRVVHHLDGV